MLKRGPAAEARVSSRYEILEKLGEGGAGVVFKARDVTLGRLVALKFLRPILLGSQEAVGGFMREARAISALSHPHIATLYALEEHDGEHFLALEYLPGGTLRDRLRQARSAGLRMPLREVVEYGIQVAGALAHAHRHGIVHRDVKPSNVLFTEDGAAKLADFGLARSGGAGDRSLAGLISGTVPYMAPEQVQCRPADHRADIFSFGVMLYEMVCGELPFSAPNEQALLQAIVSTPTPSVTARFPELPAAIERIIQTATAKDPARRYQTMQEAADALVALREPERTITVHVPRPRPRRRLVILALIALVVACFAMRARIATWLRPLPAEKQIAVLPFVNVGGDPANEPFCEGLLETVTAKLSGLKQFDGSLRVVPSTEVRREKVASALEANRRLGANLAISGSVQRFPGAVRVTVSLLDARALSQLRSDTFDARLGDLSALQDGVFVRTASMLQLELLPQARKALQAGETTRPAAYFLYVEGLGHLARYDRAESLERAAKLFADAVREDPNYALAWTGLGRTSWRTYQQTKEPAALEKARQSCARALELGPDVPAAHVLLGDVETVAGQYGRAIAQFKNALKLDTVNAEAWRGLAQAFERSGRPDEAEATYRRAIALRPRDWAGHKDLGVFYYRTGRLSDAEECFRRVVDLAPDSYWGYRNLGGLYCSMGRFDAAADYSRKSIGIVPTAPAWSNLGAIHFFQGRFAEAADAYERALALGGADQRLIRGNLAEAYRRVPAAAEKAAEQYRAALRLAERALTVNPRDAEMRANLALYAMGVGDRARALAELARARESAPENMMVSFRAALIYELAGRRREALEALGAALKQGYPRMEVDHHPDLANLRRDPGFAGLAAAKPQQEAK